MRGSQSKRSPMGRATGDARPTREGSQGPSNQAGWVHSSYTNHHSPFFSLGLIQPASVSATRPPLFPKRTQANPQLTDSLSSAVWLAL